MVDRHILGLTNRHPNAHPNARIYTNAPVIAFELEKAGADRARDLHQTVNHYTMLMMTRIMANASGRPGPNAPTGDYRRSWGWKTEWVGNTIRGRTGTSAPQARRLEYGFVGADSLGRVFNQPPYEHVGPAKGALYPEINKALARVVGGRGSVSG